jgi:hypothetical protein
MGEAGLLWVGDKKEGHRSESINIHFDCVSLERHRDSTEMDLAECWTDLKWNRPSMGRIQQDEGKMQVQRLAVQTHDMELEDDESLTRSYPFELASGLLLNGGGVSFQHEFLHQ